MKDRAKLATEKVILGLSSQGLELSTYSKPESVSVCRS